MNYVPSWDPFEVYGSGFRVRCSGFTDCINMILHNPCGSRTEYSPKA